MHELEKLNSTIMNEANKILYDQGLLEILGKYGTPVLTGSYVLELMTWRDLDIYLESNDMTEVRFFELGRDIALCLKPRRMQYRNEFVGKTPGLPLGLYWGIYITGLDFPEEWKIDIWALDSQEMELCQEEFDDLRSRISIDDRPAILTIKHQFCQYSEYQRSFSSVDVYRAVIEEDIKSIEEFARWLEKNRGIS